jgi:hypothetical protein
MLQMIGLALAALLHLPIPGVVLGLVLLVILGLVPRTRGILRRGRARGHARCSRTCSCCSSRRASA